MRRGRGRREGVREGLAACGATGQAGRRILLAHRTGPRSDPRCGGGRCSRPPAPPRPERGLGGAGCGAPALVRAAQPLLCTCAARPPPARSSPPSSPRIPLGPALPFSEVTALPTCGVITGCSTALASPTYARIAASDQPASGPRAPAAAAFTSASAASAASRPCAAPSPSCHAAGPVRAAPPRRQPSAEAPRARLGSERRWGGSCARAPPLRAASLPCAPPSLPLSSTCPATARSVSGWRGSGSRKSRSKRESSGPSRPVTSLSGALEVTAMPCMGAGVVCGGRTGLRACPVRRPRPHRFGVHGPNDGGAGAQAGHQACLGDVHRLLLHGLGRGGVGTDESSAWTRGAAGPRATPPTRAPTSWITARSLGRMPSNSSMQHNPPSASTWATPARRAGWPAYDMALLKAPCTSPWELQT